MVSHACNSSIWEVETEEPGIQGQDWLQEIQFGKHAKETKNKAQTKSKQKYCITDPYRLSISSGLCGRVYRIWIHLRLEGCGILVLEGDQCMSCIRLRRRDWRSEDMIWFGACAIHRAFHLFTHRSFRQKTNAPLRNFFCGLPMKVTYCSFSLVIATWLWFPVS